MEICDECGDECTVAFFPCGDCLCQLCMEDILRTETTVCPVCYAPLPEPDREWKDTESVPVMTQEAKVRALQRHNDTGRALEGALDSLAHVVRMLKTTTSCTSKKT